MMATVQIRHTFPRPLVKSLRGLGACPSGDIANPDWLSAGTGLCYSLDQLNQMFPNIGNDYIQSYTNRNGVTSETLGYFARLNQSYTPQASAQDYSGTNDAAVGAAINQAVNPNAVALSTIDSSGASQPAINVSVIQPTPAATSVSGVTPVPSTVSWFSSQTDIGGIALPNSLLAIGAVGLAIYFIKRHRP